MAATTIENEQLRLVIDPAAGASTLALYTRGATGWLAVMPETRNATLDLAVSNFLMLPYSNRIKEGRFVFQGQSYELAHGDRHAIHGDVRNRPWTVDRASGDGIRCTFRSTEHKAVNWPWPFEASVAYDLDGPALTSELTLWNRGDSPMPAGFGWHPYYSRWLTRQGEPVLLQFSVQGVYPDANGNRIPSGPPRPLAPEQDFSRERELLPDSFLDGCFYGYDGAGHIRWPESGVRLAYRCSAALGHLVMYNPPKAYFAIEPVTNANDGVNLLARGDATSGIQTLAPGECLTATFVVQVERE